MSTYNPIIEYFESLRGKFKGKSHIDILCSHITARDYFDKEEEGYYQNRLNYIVKKWIVASVACAYGKHPNDVALGFIQQKEGIGKTWLTEFFTPPALHSFYIKSNKDERVFSMSDAMTRNLYINFDELYGLSTRNIDEFKNMLSAKEVEIKNRGEQFIKTQQRIASVLFTTNHNAELGGFLHKSYGYRRWGTIEVETIDHDYSKHVDINQVYAEAIVLMDGQFDFVWNENDFEMLINYNQRFLIETPLMKLVQLHYTYGIEGDQESKWLRATDIIDELIKSRKITGEILKEISPVKMGEALTTLNYKREAQRIAEGPRYCYLVKSKT
jgi:predicted P-loop ATPase